MRFQGFVSVWVRCRASISYVGPTRHRSCIHLYYVNQNVFRCRIEVFLFTDMIAAMVVETIAVIYLARHVAYSWRQCGQCITDHPCTLAPENVTSSWLSTGGVQISWTHRHRHHHQHSAGGCEFVIEYRTVGQWVPLTRALNATKFVWNTASRGTIYYFRVISRDHSDTVHSPPSEPISMETGGTAWSVELVSRVMHVLLWQKSCP